MEVVKKSFEVTGDTAQLIDDFVDQNPGMSFTLIANQALDAWLKQDNLSLKLSNLASREAMHVKKSANINAAYINKIESYKSGFPGLNATFILNVALHEWLKKPTFVKPKRYTDDDIDAFMEENSELMDELAK
ncbi:MAG: hypothetical protein AB8G05_25445 [Oligoflexales bacterium]